MLGKVLESAWARNLSQRNDFVRWIYEARQAWWDLPAIKEARVGGRLFPLYLDYPLNAVPRFGHGRPTDPLVSAKLAKYREQYVNRVDDFAKYRDQLRAIASGAPDDATQPHWKNGWLHGMDMVTLYCFPALLNPKLYIEVGSGNSTKFVKAAVRRNNLQTRMVSLDPHPRAEIDSLCDQVIRRPLEDVDLTIFDQLGDGDILMIDSSHRCFQNSDVTALFLEVLPRLKPGVVIHIHDIFLPDDYPPQWKLRYYSEQYLLAVLLVADESRYDVLMPCQFLGRDEALRPVVDRFWADLGVDAVKDYGTSFWMQVRGSARPLR
jgi:hypothetical protein